MKKKTIILIIVALLAIIGALCTLTLLNSRTANPEPVRLYLPEGTTVDALCDSLTNNLPPCGRNPQIQIFHRLMDYAAGGRIRPGSYVIEPHMKNLDLVRKLRNGQQDPIRLTIGKFRLPQDLNNYLNTKLMHNDFNVTLDSFHLILPDTYEVYWTITPEQFMQRMEKEYNAFWQNEKRKTKSETTVANDSLSIFTFRFSLHDIVVLASIVEEETNNKSEKPLIASVYLNRMEKGMPLQADPTVKYAVGDFTLRRILNKHLQTESPFNTYLHTGLPPAPICLPSKETIRAVVFAPRTNYLYFCASDKLDGTHRFAATLAEHNRNAAAYHAALNRQGIKR
ncbi:MAG: endolytic transglycosylase MltG [Bacteroidales bacterium]|nr:endolytic transglycosylase MltG [Bacteroidales bacterium]